jgi:hypothetical protein
MKKHSSWLLDPPEFIAPVERWREWLASLRAMQPDYPDDPGIADEIVHAEKWIPKREELERELQALKTKAA